MGSTLAALSTKVPVSLPFSSLLQLSEAEPKYQMLLPREQLKAVVEKAVGGPERLQDIMEGKVVPVGSCVRWQCFALYSWNLRS